MMQTANKSVLRQLLRVARGPVTLHKTINLR